MKKIIKNSMYGKFNKRREKIFWLKLLSLTYIGIILILFLGHYIKG